MDLGNQAKCQLTTARGLPANLSEIYRGLLGAFRCGLIKVGSDFIPPGWGGGREGYRLRKPQGLYLPRLLTG